MVVIINSPLFRERNELYDEDSLPPIGLGYIATQLKNNGIEVSLIDAVYERIPLADLISTLTTLQPDFVATNIFTTNQDIVRDLVEGLHFKTHIIIGGLSTKQLYKSVMEWNTENPVDIVTGDGELITLDIVKNQLQEHPVFIEGNRRVYHINSASIYGVQDISDVPLDRTFFKNEPVRHPLGFFEANIVASRGCIYNCAFCAAARSLNKDFKVREKSEASIIKELDDIKKQLPSVNSIRVLDDLFLKKNTIQKAIHVFSPFHYQWRSMAHVLTFSEADDTVMAALKNSGCYELFIGIESGSPRILETINKTKDISLIIKNLTKVLKAGINIKGYFIYGFPGETEEDMQMTFDLAAELKSISLHHRSNFRTSVFQFRPYHGTELYHSLEAEGSNLKVQQVKANEELSGLVGRLQFNFHSGNYSSVDYQTLHSYIYRTINLNDGAIFSGLKPTTV